MGDPVYGRPAKDSKAPRQMLHARTLAFGHPRTGASIRVESPLPPDFREALKRLRGAARRSGLR
jgi:23S rRNA pseudouridine1911/1915/1917 synthase